MKNEDAKFLKESLLYQMSLGSKELYHSNVWAWLIENDPKFIKVFFRDYDENIYEFESVSREYKDRDLTIWFHKKEDANDKYYYVIENKIKSLQSEDQLKKYTEDLSGYVLLQGVFTGIKNALNEDTLTLPHKNAPEKTSSWEFLDYETIAQNIRAVTEACAEQENGVIFRHKAQIEEYCTIIGIIYRFLNAAVKSTANRWNLFPDEETDRDLKVLRLKDVFLKLKGADFLRYIEQRRAELDALCPKDLGFSLQLGQSFHNGKSTLDIRFDNRQENCDDYLRIGVQIEGNQYRLMAEQGGGHTGKEVFERFKGGWFDADFNCKKTRSLFGKPTKMEKAYCKYDGHNRREPYMFVYQYYIIDSSCTYETLLESILSDLRRARDIIQSDCQS